MSNTVLRAEKKYMVPLDYMYKQRRHLCALMTEDEHNGSDGYAIRSLYFDTVTDKDFNDKEDGLELRRKIRLRIYSPDATSAKLEMKQKQGANQKKRSLTVSRGDAARLAEGDYAPLLAYDDPFALECYALMRVQAYRPAAVVEYKRFAFIAKENNIRITFDHSIAATESSFDLFNENLLMYPVFDAYNVILEVKYNGFLLSSIKSYLDSCARDMLSVSKYCLARKVSQNYVL